MKSRFHFFLLCIAFSLGHSALAQVNRPAFKFSFFGTNLTEYQHIQDPVAPGGFIVGRIGQLGSAGIIRVDSSMNFQWGRVLDFSPDFIFQRAIPGTQPASYIYGNVLSGLLTFSSSAIFKVDLNGVPEWGRMYPDFVVSVDAAAMDDGGVVMLGNGVVAGNFNDHLNLTRLDAFGQRRRESSVR